DGGGIWPARLRHRHLVGPARAGEDAAPDRRSPGRRHAQSHRYAFGERALRRWRQRGAEQHAGGIRRDDQERGFALPRARRGRRREAGVARFFFAFSSSISFSTSMSWIIPCTRVSAPVWKYALWKTSTISSLVAPSSIARRTCCFSPGP